MLAYRIAYTPLLTPPLRLRSGSGRHLERRTVTLSCYATFARTCYECGLRVCSATEYLFSKQATSVICSALSCLPLPPLRGNLFAKPRNAPIRISVSKKMRELRSNSVSKRSLRPTPPKIKKHLLA
jgi:hypothetical protein